MTYRSGQFAELQANTEMEVGKQASLCIYFVTAKKNVSTLYRKQKCKIGKLYIYQLI